MKTKQCHHFIALIGLLIGCLFPAKVSASPCVLATGQCGDNLSWSFDTNTGELTISGTGPMWDYEWDLPLMDDEYNGSITSVTVEEGVTSIGDYAFYDCTGLNSVTIPNSVTSIGEDAFYGCTGLTSIEIPNSVTSIGEDAFHGCTGLASIVVERQTPLSIDSDVFDERVNYYCTLYVPIGSKSAYQNAEYWSEFTNIVEYQHTVKIDGIYYNLNPVTLTASVIRNAPTGTPQPTALATVRMSGLIP